MEEEIKDLNDQIDQLKEEAEDAQKEVADISAELETVIEQRNDLRSFLDNIVYDIQRKLKE